MTRLGVFNFLIVQWFFIRLAKVVENDELIGFLILRWVVPLTGWWSDYIYVRRKT